MICFNAKEFKGSLLSLCVSAAVRTLSPRCSKATLSEKFTEHLSNGDEAQREKIDKWCKQYLETFKESLGKAMTPRGRLMLDNLLYDDD